MRARWDELKTKQVVHAVNRAFPEGFVLVNENGGLVGLEMEPRFKPNRLSANCILSRRLGSKGTNITGTLRLSCTR